MRHRPNQDGTLEAGIRCLLSCCIGALVAAPAYAGGGPLPVIVNPVGPQEPKPEVEPHITTGAGASASGSEVPTLAPSPPELRPQTTTPPVGEGSSVSTRGGQELITCSLDKEIVIGSVACAAGATTENQFARCFDGATFFPADTTVGSLDFGIETAQQVWSPIEVIGTLYSIPACGPVLPYAEMTVLGSGSIILVGDGSENFTIQTISFGAGIAVPAGTNVVAEMAYGPENRIWPGSNPNGQTCPSYLAATPCGIQDLTDLTLIGFPDMHLVLNLNTGGGFLCPDGVCGSVESCCSCDEDCGPCACGDGICNDPCEDCENCAADCGPCPVLQQYTITKVDTLGGSGGIGLAVNDLGQVTVSVDTSEGLRHAYLWTAGEIIDLGTFPPFAQSEAWGMNNVAQVVGIATNSGDYSHGFLWENGKMIDLGDLVDPGDRDTDAMGINDSGQVVGFTEVESKEWHAFLWEDGTMTDIPSQLGGSGSRALDINALGHIVGGAGNGSDGLAFLMIDGVMTDLGTLGGPDSRAFGVNDFDQVVGRSERPEGGNVFHAFFWEKGEMTDLGKIGGFSSSQAYAINNSGQVIGAPGFLYHRQTGMQNLEDLLPPDTQWVGLNPRDINNVGQIVGSGNFQGSPGRPFLMTPIDADFNDDGHVDLDDFMCLAICFTGPEIPAAKECQPSDIDRDGDVDLDDFNAFRWVMDGP